MDQVNGSGGYFVFSFMLTAMIFISVYSKQTPVAGDWKLHQFLRSRGANVTPFLEGGLIKGAENVLIGFLLEMIWSYMNNTIFCLRVQYVRIEKMT